MTSIAQENSCIACQQGVVTCIGCGESFCDLHIAEHRQEIDVQKGTVLHKYNELHEALNGQQTGSYFFTRIKRWEDESIQQIKTTAQQARQDLQAYIDCAKHQLSDSLREVGEELRASEKLNVYTEKEVSRWLKKLEQLQNMVRKPPTIDIVEDTVVNSAICMIKVIAQTDGIMKIKQKSLQTSTPTKKAETMVKKVPLTSLTNDDDQLIQQFLTDYDNSVTWQLTHTQNIQLILQPKLEMFFKQLGCTSDEDIKSHVEKLVSKYTDVLTIWRTHYQNIFQGLQPLLKDEVLAIRNTYCTESNAQ